MSNPTNTNFAESHKDDEHVPTGTSDEDRVQDATGEGSDLKSHPEPAEENRPSRDNSEELQDDASEEEPDTFPREYVEKLRKENADARAKVKDRDDLAQRLHTALAAADGRLADPTDLPYSEDQLDPETMGKAIGDLVARKPHLKARRVTGDVGQGSRGSTSSEVNLLGLLKGSA